MVVFARDGTSCYQFVTLKQRLFNLLVMNYKRTKRVNHHLKKKKNMFCFINEEGNMEYDISLCCLNHYKCTRSLAVKNAINCSIHKYLNPISKYSFTHKKIKVNK